MSIQRIPYDAPRSEFTAALEKDGCVVVTSFTDESILENARKEVQPYLDIEEPNSTLGALNGGTKTCTRLIGRSKTVREKFFSSPLYQVIESYMPKCCHIISGLLIFKGHGCSFLRPENDLLVRYRTINKHMPVSAFHQHHNGHTTRYIGAEAPSR